MLSGRKFGESAVVGLGVGLKTECSNDLHFYYGFCINRQSATNKWNWCHVRSGRVALWGRKRDGERGLGICILQWNRWSVCHPYAWGGRLPAYHLDPCYGAVTLDSMEENGTRLSRGVRALSLRAGKSGRSSWLQYSELWLGLWRNATLLSNTCLVACSSCW